MKIYLQKRKSTKHLLSSLKNPLNSKVNPELLREMLELSRFSKHNLVISHTHYLELAGGTERVIFDQAMFFEDQGIGTIQVYPQRVGQFTGSVGVTIDGVLVGMFDAGAVLMALDTQVFENIFVHHIFGMTNLEFLRRVAALKPKGKKRFYLHDFFLACPHINLRCVNSKNGTDCSRGSVEGDPKYGPFCANLFASGTINEWRHSFRWIFDQFEIIAPSEFLKGKMMEVMDVPDDRIQVIPIAEVQPTSVASDDCGPRKVKVAYLGYEAPHKGYDDWLHLVANKRLRGNCQFIHIGECRNRSQFVKYHEYDVISDGAEAPVTLLKSLDIDYVVLLSIVPESFSFTLYEAIAAGIPVLAVQSSGNIAKVVSENPQHGTCFKDVRYLTQFLMKKVLPEKSSLSSSSVDVERTLRFNPRF